MNMLSEKAAIVEMSYQRNLALAFILSAIIVAYGIVLFLAFLSRIAEGRKPYMETFMPERSKSQIVLLLGEPTLIKKNTLWQPMTPHERWLMSISGKKIVPVADSLVNEEL